MDVDKLYKLREKLADEMAKTGSEGELSVGCLDLIKKLGECIEMVDEVIESTDGGMRGSGERYGRGPMRRYGTGPVWRMPPVQNGQYYMSGRGSYGGYGHGTAGQIETMMNNAKSARLREVLAEAYEIAQAEE